MFHNRFARLIGTTVIAAALSWPTTAAGMTHAAPLATGYDCAAPEGFFQFCNSVNVRRGFKLVIYNRTSQNETIRFEVRSPGGVTLERITLDERESGTYANNRGYSQVSIYVSSKDNDVRVQGTFSVVRI